VPPPPLGDEPPQAARKIKPENSRHPSRKLKIFFLREIFFRDLKPAPISASPPIGSHIANSAPFVCGVRNEVVVAVVLMVNVEVPEPPVTEVGTSVQVGAGLTTGAMLHVRFTVSVKPLNGAIVIVEVADPPAVTAAGESAVAVMAKSADGAA
jgi:hypothetical protein